MMKKTTAFLFLFLFFLFHVGARAQTSATKASPEEWLKTKGYELISILSEEETKTRYVKLRQIAKDVFNQQELTRLAMGRYWRSLTPEQQDNLRYMFFDYFVVSYGSMSLGFTNIEIKVTEKQLSGKDILLKVRLNVDFDKESFAGLSEQIVADKKSSNATTTGQPNYIEIFFALRETPTGYYIRDAKVEGQSILMFLRTRLEEEMQAAGNDPAAFLEEIRTTINSRYRAAEDLARLHSNQEDKNAGSEK